MEKTIYFVIDRLADLKGFTLEPEEALVLAEFLGKGSMIFYGWRNCVWVEGKEKETEEGLDGKACVILEKVGNIS